MTTARCSSGQQGRGTDDPRLGGTQYDLGSMHKILQRAGFTTHSLTLPGHGTTPEDLVDVKAEDWIEAVQKLYRELVGPEYETLHICGMCMGALLSASSSLKRERHSKGKLVAWRLPSTSMAGPRRGTSDCGATCTGSLVATYEASRRRIPMASRTNSSATSSKQSSHAAKRSIINGCHWHASSRWTGCAGGSWRGSRTSPVKLLSAMPAKTN